MSTPVRRAAPLPLLFAKAVLTARLGGDTLPAGGAGLSLAGVGIDDTRLSTYQRVCGYRVSDSVPATFLHVLAFPLATEIMAARRFPLPLVGLVHVANRTEQLRPVRRGETVDLDVRAADLRPHRSGRQVDLLATVSVGGEVVVRETSTYLHRERTAGTAEAAGADRATPPPAAGGRDGGAGAEVQWRLPADTGRRYAAVSGDVNPIHLHRLTARAFGFARPIAHGMWLAARTLSALEARLPAAFVHEVQFRRPVPLPSTVRYRARTDGGGWSLAVTSVDGGTTHLTGAVHPLNR